MIAPKRSLAHFYLIGAVAALFSLLCVDSFFWADDFWLLRIAKEGNVFSWWYTIFEEFKGYWPLYDIHFTNPSARYFWYFRPVTTLSLMLDYKLWGPDAFMFHISQSLLFVLAGILFYLVASMLVERRAALVASLFFSASPMLAETQAWIAARSGIIALVLVMFSLILVRLWLYSKAKYSWLYAIGSIMSGILAILAKESAMVLVLWMGALLAVNSDGSRRAKILWVLAGFAVISIPMLIAIKTVFAPPLPLRIESLHLLALLSPDAGVRFLQNEAQYVLSSFAFIPVFPDSIFHGNLIGALVLFALLGLFLWWFGRYVSGVREASLFAALWLLPMVPFGIVSPVSERYLLFPMLGVSLLWGRLIVHVWDSVNTSSRAMRYTIAGVVIVLFVSYSVWHHRMVGMPGRGLKRYTEQMLQDCRVNGRMYIGNRAWGAVLIDKAAAVLHPELNPDIITLNFDPSPPDERYFSIPGSRFMFCRMDPHNCPNVHTSYEYLKDTNTLTLTIDDIGFFDTIMERFIGVSAWAKGKTGAVFYRTGMFGVWFSDLSATGFPKRIDFRFDSASPPICVYSKGKFVRLQ